jgi:hypothetical protein
MFYYEQCWVVSCIYQEQCRVVKAFLEESKYTRWFYTFFRKGNYTIRLQMFDIFNINFDHLFYLKYEKLKYIFKIHYVINHIAFDFFSYFE